MAAELGHGIGRGVRVLVVDDTAHVRQLLVEMLGLDGFEVVGSAADGEAALALAEETDPHVVVMDLQMPGMDGLETTRQMRAQRPNQPIVIYTAYLSEGVEAAAAAAGAALCLGKVEGLPRLEQELARLTLGVARGT